MKLLQYPNDSHHKNRESMIRMCAAWNIEYEATNDKSKCNDPSVTILWLPMFWVNPDEFPGKYILYGPQHFIFPQGPIIGPENKEWSKRCVYLSLSNWVHELYREFTNESVIPFVPLGFGINPAIEDSKATPKELDCIIYVKRRNRVHVNFIKETLNELSLRYRVFEYGSYQNSEYMNALKTTKICIWIGTHESQGFAFQECLASNVPILCIDATTMFDELQPNGVPVYEYLRGQKQLKSTSATKWSSECGEKIDSIEVFKDTLDIIFKKLDTYTPRKFILDQQSDYIAMKAILDYFNISDNRLYFCITAAEVEKTNKYYDLRKAEYTTCLNRLNAYQLNNIVVCSETNKDTSILDIIHKYLTLDYFVNIPLTSEFGAKTKSQQEYISLQILFNNYNKIKPHDWIIKISGRYLLINDTFINIVKEHSNTNIGFIGKKSHQHPQVYTFLYAIRYKYLDLFLKNNLDYIGCNCIENKLYEFLNEQQIECKFLNTLGVFTNIANDSEYQVY
jgi:hypothetical protein